MIKFYKLFGGGWEPPPPPPKPPLNRHIVESILWAGVCPKCGSSLLRKNFFSFKTKCCHPECTYDSEYALLIKAGPFVEGQIVKHLKSGNKYIILKTPNEDDRLEYCDLPFYKYQSLATGKVWNRRFDEMEDGRFILE